MFLLHKVVACETESEKKKDSSSKQAYIFNSSKIWKFSLKRLLKSVSEEYNLAQETECLANTKCEANHCALVINYSQY